MVENDINLKIDYKALSCIDKIRKINLNKLDAKILIVWCLWLCLAIQTWSFELASSFKGLPSMTLIVSSLFLLLVLVHISEHGLLLFDCWWWNQKSKHDLHCWCLPLTLLSRISNSITRKVLNNSNYFSLCKGAIIGC